MNHPLKSQCKVKPGTVIEGKWHKKRYTIVKELGYGANGIVYLARGSHEMVALKMSNNGMSITSEVNVLKSFAKVQGSVLGPSLLDVDDWQTSNQPISFYVMEYIKGNDLLTFIEQKGVSWLPVLILQLLADLEILHENGWVFGDLKPENLIITDAPAKIRCIDVGGTTIKGRAIKEFTEFYDRGYWELGSRKADPQYDLFAVAMIMINVVYPKKFNKTTGGISQLHEQIKNSKLLVKFESVLLNSLQGNYQSALEMRNDLLKIISNKSIKPQTRRSSASTTPSKRHKTVTRRSGSNNKRKSGFLETSLILIIVLFFYVVYILGELI
jgi:serine/threonine-protein kinase